MTRHVAISFSENGDAGYILGSDSTTIIERETVSSYPGGEPDYRPDRRIIVEQMEEEKMFHGEDLVGLIAGTVTYDGDFSIGRYREMLDSLARELQGIRDGKEYTHMAFEDPGSSAIVARRRSGKVELFAILPEGSTSKAIKLDEVSPGSLEGSSVWIRPEYYLEGYAYLRVECESAFDLEVAGRSAAQIIESKEIANSQDPEGFSTRAYLYMVTQNKLSKVFR